MEKSIAAVAVVLVIVIAIVGAYALSMDHAPINSSTSTAASTTSVAGSSSSLSTTVSPASTTIVANSVTTTIGNTNYVSGCTASAGFNCTNANMSTYGQLTFSLEQKSGATFTDVHLACGVLAANGSVVNASSWYALTNDGTLKSANFSGADMASGNLENIASLQCYNQTGRMASVAVGQSYQGAILIMYGNSSATSGATKLTTAVAAHINLNVAKG
jgi:hypothetical protein